MISVRHDCTESAAVPRVASLSGQKCVTSKQDGGFAIKANSIHLDYYGSIHDYGCNAAPFNFLVISGSQYPYIYLLQIYLSLMYFYGVNKLLLLLLFCW